MLGKKPSYAANTEEIGEAVEAAQTTRYGTLYKSK